MKSFLKVFVFIFSLTLLFIQCEYEPDPNEPVNIPDNVFLAALIEQGVDTNGDSLISYTEAEAVSTLNVAKRNSGPRIGISDMTGIEAFVNLDTLDCSYNSYHSIDVSTILGLIYLDCSESKLIGLDVTNNHQLTHLDCSDYQIPELILTNNPHLTYLNCHNNLMTSLDLTHCNDIRILWCQENQLTSLDVSNCINLYVLQLHNMPTLHEICVWTTPFPPPGVSITTYNSPNVYFTTNCSK